MQTKVVKIDSANIDDAAMKEACDLIRAGELVAFPTETVYGLGADALHPEASKKIYAAREDPSEQPLIVHISKFEDRISREGGTAAGEEACGRVLAGTAYHDRMEK